MVQAVAPATQNPIEQEGTYMLPEAQVDRFMLKVVIDYPKQEEEKLIMRQNMGDQQVVVTPVLHPNDIIEARKVVKDVYMDEKIERYILGNYIIEPATGELASGLEGKGRMEEPEKIVQYLDNYFEPKNMAGKKVLITAGPTYEKIDPVRFVGNYSSGKMGFALAEVCAKQGAQVTLVTGPVSLSLKNKNIIRINVESAEEMHKTVMSKFEEMDGAILCAAVADFRPVETSDTKFKRKDACYRSGEFKP
jgi:hypothetical protein